jgi:broad-specificity NMP kinase
VPVVLLTGMSGTGTTSVLNELDRRGYCGIDTDYDGWCVEVDGDRIWDADRMRRFIDEAGSDTVFVSGCVSNQVEFDFAAVVLLSAPESVILDRVAHRTNNPYGSTEADRAEISAALLDVEPLLRSYCDLELDATLPISELADRVERLTLS